ncbi:MAG: hypothetical protein EOL95_06675 [Bacteroidia bacterium]|jgi:hypothetical protein|nr:hypothetical protein [Bacteroidia bacterium]
MKNKFLFKTIILLVLTVLLSSCMATRTNVNGFNEAQGQTYKYDKVKQCYLFWGLIPLGRSKAHTPDNKRPCQIRTYYSFGDAIVSSILGGLFEMQTIKVIAKRTPGDQDYFAVGDEVTYKSGTKYLRGVIMSIIDGESCTLKNYEGKVIKMKFERMSK